MQTLHFSYRYEYNPNDGNCRYTPAMNWDKKYPELKGVANMECEIIPEGSYRSLHNGEISGVRVGRLIYDEAILASFGKDSVYLKNELARVGSNFAIIIETNESLAEFVMAYTNLVELEPNLFEISPETTSIMPGMEGVVPQVVLDLR